MSVTLIVPDDVVLIDVVLPDFDAAPATRVVLRLIPATARRDSQVRFVTAAQPTQRTDAPGGPEHLTNREFQVLQMLADGFANKEIARRLCISEKTVKSHISTILAKFGLQSRTQVAMEGVRLGLVQTHDPRIGPSAGASSQALDGDAKPS